MSLLSGQVQSTHADKPGLRCLVQLIVAEVTVSLWNQSALLQQKFYNAKKTILCSNMKCCGAVGSGSVVDVGARTAQLLDPAVEVRRGSVDER